MTAYRPQSQRGEQRCYDVREITTELIYNLLIEKHQLILVSSKKRRSTTTIALSYPASPISFCVATIGLERAQIIATMAFFTIPSKGWGLHVFAHASQRLSDNLGSRITIKKLGLLGKTLMHFGSPATGWQNKLTNGPAVNLPLVVNTSVITIYIYQ